MFERYESNFNLDLWERINTNSIPEWLGETAPVGIEKTIVFVSFPNFLTKILP